MASKGKANESKVTFSPLTPHTGAEVHGLDLAAPISAEAADMIRNAFVTYSVLLFRDQTLAPVHLSRFTRIFGEPHVHHLAEHTYPDHPEVRMLSNAKNKDGKFIGQYRGGHYWHSDVSYGQVTGLVTMLYGVTCPPEGADTLFANMCAAYEDLPGDLKSRIEGRLATHDRGYNYAKIYPERPPLTPAQLAEVPPVQHPAVVTHPDTGRRSIYVYSTMVSHVDGMDSGETRELVREIEEFATQDKYVYRHKWREGDLALWDNRCTLHTATPYDDTKYDRVMLRTQVVAGRPFF